MLDIPYVGPAKSGGCEARAHACLCRYKAGHKGKVHRCECGGAWTGTEPEYVPVRLPQGLRLADILGLGRGF